MLEAATLAVAAELCSLGVDDGKSNLICFMSDANLGSVW